MLCFVGGVEIECVTAAEGERQGADQIECQVSVNKAQNDYPIIAFT